MYQTLAELPGAGLRALGHELAPTGTGRAPAAVMRRVLSRRLRASGLSVSVRKYPCL
jgi:hypothetical protein